MYRKILEYIETWENRCYPDGIPDEAPIELNDKVPSYKKICIAILKNDVALETLGFTKPKCEIYSLLKRKELNERFASNERKIKDNI